MTVRDSQTLVASPEQQEDHRAFQPPMTSRRSPALGRISAQSQPRPGRRGQATRPLGRHAHEATSGSLCRAAVFHPTRTPPATGDRASQAILRPVDSPKCPETASDPVAEASGLGAFSPTRQILGPLLHQDAAALEEVRAGVGRLHLVADRVRQRGLHDRVGRVGALRRPVPEARTEPVRHGSDPKRLQQAAEVHARQMSPVADGNTHSERRACALASARTSSARHDSGTRCSRRPFIRFAGIVHSPPSMSISSHRVPRTSPDRQAVSTRNSVPSFTESRASDCRTVAIAPATSS